MYALRAYINHLFLKTFYGELKKFSKKWVTFSFFRKTNKHMQDGCQCTDSQELS